MRSSEPKLKSQVYSGVLCMAPEHLEVANRLKEEGLCLSFYGKLALEQVQAICGIIGYLHHFPS